MKVLCHLKGLGHILSTIGSEITASDLPLTSQPVEEGSRAGGKGVPWDMERNRKKEA